MSNSIIRNSKGSGKSGVEVIGRWVTKWISINNSYALVLIDAAHGTVWEIATSEAKWIDALALMQFRAPGEIRVKTGHFDKCL